MKTTQNESISDATKNVGTSVAPAIATVTNLIMTRENGVGVSVKRVGTDEHTPGLLRKVRIMQRPPKPAGLKKKRKSNTMQDWNEKRGSV